MVVLRMWGNFIKFRGPRPQVGFGQVAGVAIATAIDHDEQQAAEARRKEERKVEETRKHFSAHVKTSRAGKNVALRRGV